MQDATLIVCLDGVGYEYISQRATPTLYELSRQYSLRRLNTLLAFTGLEYSFFTGKYPDEHNIWVEFIYSPETSPFKWLGAFSVMENTVLRSALSYLSIALQLVGGRTFVRAIHNIPLDLAGYFDTATPDYLWKFKGLFFQQLLEREINFLYITNPFMIKKGAVSIDPINRSDEYKGKKMIENCDEDFLCYYTHLVDVDKAAHKFGVGSQEYLDILKRDDLLLAKMIGELERVHGSINIVIWSDHGLANLKGHIDIQAKLASAGDNGKDYVAFYDSTMARFWFQNNRAERVIRSELERTEHGHILSEQEREKYRIPRGRAVGELIFLADTGYVIYPNYYQREAKIEAAHGYAPDHHNLAGFLLSNLCVNSTQEDLQMVDGYWYLTQMLRRD